MVTLPSDQALTTALAGTRGDARQLRLDVRRNQ